MTPGCLRAYLTKLRHALNETRDAVLGYLFLDLDQGITELLDSQRCNLPACDGPKHNVPEAFYWIPSSSRTCLHALAK